MPVIPVQESESSVFDPLLKTLLDRVGGGTPDTSDIAGLMGPIGVPAGLISKIPFKEVLPRNIALRSILEKQNASPHIMEAFDYAAKKYPRILAHVETIEQVPLEQAIKWGGVGGTAPIPFQPGKSYIGLSPEAMNYMVGKRDVPTEIVDTFGHELTHAAQNAWNPKTSTAKYDELKKAFGYYDNPYEVGARKSADKFVKRVMEPAGQVKLIKNPPTPVEPGMIQKLMDMFDLNK